MLMRTKPIFTVLKILLLESSLTPRLAGYRKWEGYIFSLRYSPTNLGSFGWFLRFCFCFVCLRYCLINLTFSLPEKIENSTFFYPLSTGKILKMLFKKAFWRQSVFSLFWRYCLLKTARSYDRAVGSMEEESYSFIAKILLVSLGGFEWFLCFFILVNPFNTAKIKNYDFRDSNNSADLKINN